MSNEFHMPITSLHEHFLKSISNKILSHSDISQKPFEVDLIYPFPPKIRLYLYNLTCPPGGRSLGEHKIQIIIPGQKRGIRSNFNYGDGRLVLLAGYDSRHDVFVFWDAGLYTNFPFSMNVQVKAETVYAAFTGMVVHQERKLHSGPMEIVTAAPSELLPRALRERIDLTLERLLRDEIK